MPLHHQLNDQSPQQWNSHVNQLNLIHAHRLHLQLSNMINKIVHVPSKFPMNNQHCNKDTPFQSHVNLLQYFLSRKVEYHQMQL